MYESLRQIRSTFACLQNRNLRIYIRAQTISLLGTWMQNTAQAWLVWKLSGSAMALGLVAMMSTFPFLILGPWTGVWADRLDRRKLLIMTQTLALSLALLLAFLIQTDMVKLWHVFVIASVLGCVSALDMPTHQAFLGDLSGTKHVRDAFLISNMSFQLTRLVGPVLAGWIIAYVGLAPAFWLNAVSFLSVIIALQKLRAPQARELKRNKSFQEFLDGFKFVQLNSKIQYLFLYAALVTCFAFSNMQILAAYADNALHGQARVFGWLMGASGLGALAGSLIVAPLVQKVPRVGILLAIASTWTGLSFFFLALSSSVALSIMAIASAALTIPSVMATASGLVQAMAEEKMRARLSSTWYMVIFGTQPFASLWVGFYAQHTGVRQAIALNGLLLVIASWIFIIGLRDLRQWKTLPMVSTESPTSPPGM